MAEIRHYLLIDAPPAKVYEAVTTQAGCNYHWGCYLRSLKLFCETGAGHPFQALPHQPSAFSPYARDTR